MIEYAVVSITRVDAEVLEDMVKERERINSVGLSTIELYRDGKLVEFSAEDIREWKFIGLNNIDFLMERLGI